ncbi:MAG: hypothetical protein OXP71_18615 [Candidatus Poribacteria bacterium]|nr:hypothetical protein [Candidatus Poribacteria bacterium]
MMIIAKCHQQTSTRDANRHLSARIEVVTHFVILLLPMYFGVFSANAQKQQEQIVFVSEVAELEQIHLRKAGGGRVKTNKLTLQEPEGSYFTPSLSFDGEQVAFASRLGRNYDIYVMELRSRKQRRVTFAQSRDLYPSWAPDGGRIAFASDKDGVFNLYTIEKNGENRTRLTNSSGDDIQPDWSPDGSKIVFASDQASAVHQVYWMHVRTGHQQQLTQRTFHIRYPRWSPDGTRVAFYSGVSAWVPPLGKRQIWQVSADGTGLKSLITDGDYNDAPVISHDLKRIAFSSTRGGNTDIYTYDRDSMQIHRITHDPSDDYQPSWSPDGKHLVFVSDRTGNPDIHKMNVDGGGIVRLTRSDADETMPAWSPRGNMICFVRKVGDDVLGRQEIRVMDSNGNGQMRLDYIPHSNRFPAWSPQGDKIAFVNRPERLSRVVRIYTVDIDGQNKRLLFETLDGAIRKISWSPNGRQIAFVYHSSRDGILQEIRILNVHTRKVNTIELKVVDDFKVVEFQNAAWAPIGRTIVFSGMPLRPVSTVPSFRYGIFLTDADGDKTQEPEPLWDTFIPKKQYP